MPQTIVTSRPAPRVVASKSVGSVASALLGQTSSGKTYHRPLGVATKYASKKHVAAKKTPSAPKKKQRAKPGKRAAQEVRKYQNSTELELRKLPFQRCVREIVAELNTNKWDFKMQAEGIYYLQESFELYLAGLYDDSWRVAKHRDKKTLFPKDLHFVRHIRKETDD